MGGIKYRRGHPRCARRPAAAKNPFSPIRLQPADSQRSRIAPTFNALAFHSSAFNPRTYCSPSQTMLISKASSPKR